MTVTDRDEQISSLIARIYDASGDAASWELVLSDLARLIGVPSLGFRIEYRPHGVFRAEGLRQAWVGLPERLTQRYVDEGFWREDPWVPAAERFPVGTLVTGRRDLEVQDPRIARSAFVNELIKPAGFVDVIGSVLIRNDDTIVTFSTMHDGTSPESEKEICGWLRTFSPHIMRSIKTELDREIMTLAVDELGGTDEMALFLVTEMGLIAYANGSGEHALRDGSFLRSEGGPRGRLRARDSADDRHLQALLIGARSGFSLRLRVDDDRSVIVNGAPTMQGGRRYTRVLCIDTASIPKMPTRILEQAYGLTSAESRLAVLIGQGASPRDAADTLGVQVSTVRSQLVKVFDKCDVRRQSELVRLVQQLAHLVPRHR